MFYAAVVEASSNIRMAFQVLYIHLGPFYTVSFINSIDYPLYNFFFSSLFLPLVDNSFYRVAYTDGREERIFSPTTYTYMDHTTAPKYILARTVPELTHPGTIATVKITLHLNATN